jgi:hypothetical protein
MTTMTFDQESHTYRISGIELPSVTRLLKPLTDESFAGIPQYILKEKADLGTAIHYATELDDLGQLDESTVHPVVAPYLEAWRKFKAEHAGSMEILKTEHKWFHKTLRYAGTVDRVLWFDGGPTILDLKSTVEIYPHVGVQLAGYAMLAESNGEVKARDFKRMALQLTPEGTYNKHFFNDQLDFACFMSLLTLFNWKAKYK